MDLSPFHLMSIFVLIERVEMVVDFWQSDYSGTLEHAQMVVGCSDRDME